MKGIWEYNNFFISRSTKMNKRIGQPAVPSKKDAREPDRDNIADSQMEETVALTWAATLARKGKLPQAEALLRPFANKAQATPDVLDMLAKIYAQQMKIEEARNLWLRAVQLDPDNTHFYRALIRCADLLKHGKSD
jgi:predicted Zn-dependent protease